MFPEICNKTITLFCCVSKNEVTKYYKYTLNNCFLNSNSIYIRNKTGVEQSVSCILEIPYQDGFVSKKEWLNMSDTNRLTNWSVGVSDKDFFIDGDIVENIPPQIEADIRKKYNCYTIKKVDVKPNFDGGIHRISVQAI